MLRRNGFASIKSCGSRAVFVDAPQRIKEFVALACEAAYRAGTRIVRCLRINDPGPGLLLNLPDGRCSSFPDGDRDQPQMQ